jgi:hypothetical protein
MTHLSRFLVLLIVALLATAPLGASAVYQTQWPTVTASPSETSPGIFQVLGLVLGVTAFGAIRLKNTADLAKKFVRNASGAAGEYTDGVKAAGQDWETAASGSGDNYAAGTQAAIADRRFEKGVREAGAARYVTRAGTLGAQRYPTGVAAAEGDWSTGAQPYLQAIAGMDLPPRRPKGDPANMQRAQHVAQRLRAIKIGK